MWLLVARFLEIDTNGLVVSPRWVISELDLANLAKSLSRRVTKPQARRAASLITRQRGFARKKSNWSRNPGRFERCLLTTGYAGTFGIPLSECIVFSVIGSCGWG
ncbi:hypothetical protein FN846DRAFT_921296 [Sphaerosporella brunnea]|uniref:Uncharacterized protein n=1 Tax=Sphaerosporella brunnea TaxID=1250544 RepID=A0A5J5EPE8_9PEZI|nr:hypothetical protein FN846DRAFT_921296 [Sphaerosporella brunnea]